MTRTLPSRDALPGRRAASLIVLCLVLSACGGSAGPAGTEALSPLGEAEGSEQGKEAGRKGSGKGSKKQASGQDDGRSSEGADPSGQDPAAGSAPAARSRPGISSVRDPVGDPEQDGKVPDWADLTGAALRDTGEALHATASFASLLPGRMPDESNVAQVALRLELPKENAHLFAEGGRDGWKAYVSRNKKATELPPGSFLIAGDQMSWTVPWKALGDPRRVDWGLHLSWTETTLLRVNYAFDSAPDAGTERLRRR